MSASAWGISNALERRSRFREISRSIAPSSVRPPAGPSSSLARASEPDAESGATTADRVGGPMFVAGGAGSRRTPWAPELAVDLGPVPPNRFSRTAPPSPGLFPSGFAPAPGVVPSRDGREDGASASPLDEPSPWPEADDAARADAVRNRARILPRLW